MSELYTQHKIKEQIEKVTQEYLDNLRKIKGMDNYEIYIDLYPKEALELKKEISGFKTLDRKGIQIVKWKNTNNDNYFIFGFQNLFQTNKIRKK